jgi:hypothetical protein
MSANDATDLKNFAITFARLIAGLAVDPHGYFEMKYVARITHSESELEVRGVLTQLIEWASSSSVSDSERHKLDKELTELGFPKVAELRLQYLP